MGNVQSRRKGDPTRGQGQCYRYRPSVYKKVDGGVTWALRLGARNDDYPELNTVTVPSQGSGCRRPVWLRSRRSCALRRLVSSGYVNDTAPCHTRTPH
jgi:hypothetical protein